MEGQSAGCGSPQVEHLLLLLNYATTTTTTQLRSITTSK
jgi:hypothetical protein